MFICSLSLFALSFNKVRAYADYGDTPLNILVTPFNSSAVTNYTIPADYNDNFMLEVINTTQIKITNLTKNISRTYNYSLRQFLVYGDFEVQIASSLQANGTWLFDTYSVVDALSFEVYDVESWGVTPIYADVGQLSHTSFIRSLSSTFLWNYISNIDYSPIYFNRQPKASPLTYTNVYYGKTALIQETESLTRVVFGVSDTVDLSDYKASLSDLSHMLSDAYPDSNNSVNVYIYNAFNVSMVDMPLFPTDTPPPQFLNVSLVVFEMHRDAEGYIYQKLLLYDSLSNLLFETIYKADYDSPYYPNIYQPNLVADLLSDNYSKGYSEGIATAEKLKEQYKDEGFTLGYYEALEQYGFYINGSYVSGAEAYSMGYNKGTSEGFETGGFLFVLSSAFSGVAMLLGIELLPNITLGMIVAVPLVFGILFFILGKKKE